MKVAVVGLGLIGGSFEKASRQAGHEVYALHHGDESGFEEAELVLICLPPEAIVPWIRSHQSRCAAGAILVDICGVKTDICRELYALQQPTGNHQPSPFFVGGHPMAGREVAGYANSLANLFVGASMIITPQPSTPETVIAKLKDYFASIGFLMTLVTTPERHDEMIAFTSQLCHIISTAFARDERVADAIGFSAGSYADMTRIATQNADDWSSLYRSNRSALLTVLDGFIDRLSEFRAALAADDTERMKEMIIAGTEAKKAELAKRQSYVPRGDEPYRSIPKSTVQSDDERSI